MQDFLTEPFRDALNDIAPWVIAARLLVALVIGWIISLIYRWTLHKPAEGTLPATLVILCVLIAITTQVIGNSVARAFSLVGALSIVRFRTVVRDTRDTAFVIFAVVIGMAVGAQHLWVAGVGTAIVGLAAFLMFLGSKEEAGGEYDHVLRVRVGLDCDIEKVIIEGLPAATKPRLMALTTAKQGTLREATFGLMLKSAFGVSETVNRVHSLPGVHDVRLVRHGFEVD